MWVTRAMTYAKKAFQAHESAHALHTYGTNLNYYYLLILLLLILFIIYLRSLSKKTIKGLFMAYKRPFA